MMGKRFTDEDLDIVLKEYDANGDGCIDLVRTAFLDAPAFVALSRARAFQSCRTITIVMMMRRRSMSVYVFVLADSCAPQKLICNAGGVFTHGQVATQSSLFHGLQSLHYLHKQSGYSLLFPKISSSLVFLLPPLFPRSLPLRSTPCSLHPFLALVVLDT